MARFYSEDASQFAPWALTFFCASVASNFARWAFSNFPPQKRPWFANIFSEIHTPDAFQRKVAHDVHFRDVGKFAGLSGLKEACCLLDGFELSIAGHCCVKNFSRSRRTGCLGMGTFRRKGLDIEFQLCRT